MNRDRWTSQISPYLQPADDPELAAKGVMQPKPQFRLSFLLPYASVTAFPDNYLNLASEDCLVVFIAEEGEETVHKVSWASIGTVSIEFEEVSPEDAEKWSRMMIAGEL